MRGRTKLADKCSFTRSVCNCDWIYDNGCRRYLSQKTGAGPIDFDWICKHPLSQLAHHSRIKGHFVTIFDAVRSRRTSTNCFGMVGVGIITLIWFRTDKNPGFSMYSASDADFWKNSNRKLPGSVRN